VWLVLIWYSGSRSQKFFEITKILYFLAQRNFTEIPVELNLKFYFNLALLLFTIITTITSCDS